MAVGLLATTFCVIFSVVVHLFLLRLLWRIGQPRLKNRRGMGIGVAAMVLGCMVGHILEIGIFAFGLFVVAELDVDSKAALAEIGFRHEQLDVWYYSAAFYTSLGASRPPSAGLRLFVGCEALAGLMLITWTASFLFLLMQKDWSEKHHP